MVNRRWRARLHEPRHRRPWALLLVALAALGTGGALADGLPATPGTGAIMSAAGRHRDFERQNHEARCSLQAVLPSLPPGTDAACLIERKLDDAGVGRSGLHDELLRAIDLARREQGCPAAPSDPNPRVAPLGHDAGH